MSQGTEAEKANWISRIKALFGDEASNMSFELTRLSDYEGPVVIAKCKTFLKTEKWRGLNETAKAEGGKYTSSPVRGWIFPVENLRETEKPRPAVSGGKKDEELYNYVGKPVDTGIRTIDDKHRDQNQEEDIAWLDPKTIKPNPYNPNEMTEEEFTALVESMRREGPREMTPIEVRLLEGGLYQLIDGEHRWEAARRMDWTRIRCMVRKVDADRAMEINYVKNRLRGRFNPFKEAEVFQIAYGRLETQAAVADRYGVSQTYVAQTLALRKMPEEVQRIIPRGINRSVLEVLSRVDDPGDLESIAKQMSRETTVHEAETMVHDVLVKNVFAGKGEPPSSEEAAFTPQAAGGVDLISRPPSSEHLDTEKGEPPKTEPRAGKKYVCDKCGVTREAWEVGEKNGKMLCSVCKSPVKEIEAPSMKQPPTAKKLDVEERGAACPVCGRTLAADLYERLKTKFAQFTGLFR